MEYDYQNRGYVIRNLDGNSDFFSKVFELGENSENA